MRKAVLARRSDDVRWLPPCPDVADRLLHQLARRDDRFVRSHQMLVAAVLHRPLARGGESVVSLKSGAHAREGLGVHRFAVLQKTVGFLTDQSVIGTELRAFTMNQLLLQRCSRAVNE